MTVTCPACHASLTIPDERLPRDTVVPATCPRCKGRIAIDTTGAAPVLTATRDRHATEPSAPAPEASAAYEQASGPRALVCTAVPAEQEQVLPILTREGFVVHVAADVADPIQRLRFTAYALVLLREGFGSAAGDGNPVLEFLGEMGMATRRRMHLVFVSPDVRSHDTTAAFVRSANVVLQVRDLPHLGEALKRSRTKVEQAYRVFLESMRAMGKG